MDVWPDHWCGGDSRPPRGGHVRRRSASASVSFTSTHMEHGTWNMEHGTRKMEHGTHSIQTMASITCTPSTPTMSLNSLVFPEKQLQIRHLHPVPFDAL